MSKLTKAIEAYGQACERRDALTLVEAKGFRIDVPLAVGNSGGYWTQAAIGSINDDLAKSLEQYKAQVLTSMAKRITEEVAFAWQALQAAKQEAETPSGADLKVVK